MIEVVLFVVAFPFVASALIPLLHVAFVDPEKSGYIFAHMSKSALIPVFSVLLFFQLFSSGLILYGKKSMKKFTIISTILHALSTGIVFSYLSYIMWSREWAVLCLIFCFLSGFVSMLLFSYLFDEEYFPPLKTCIVSARARIFQVIFILSVILLLIFNIVTPYHDGKIIAVNLTYIAISVVLLIEFMLLLFSFGLTWLVKKENESFKVGALFMIRFIYAGWIGGAMVASILPFNFCWSKVVALCCLALYMIAGILALGWRDKFYLAKEKKEICDGSLASRVITISDTDEMVIPMPPDFDD